METNWLAGRLVRVSSDHRKWEYTGVGAGVRGDSEWPKANANIKEVLHVMNLLNMTHCQAFSQTLPRIGTVSGMSDVLFSNHN